MAFKKRYKSRTRTKPGSPFLREGGGEKNRAKGKEKGRSRYEETRQNTNYLTANTPRMRAGDVERDVVGERKHDGINFGKEDTRTRKRKRSQGPEHRARAREFGKNGAALTFMKMKL